MINKINNYLKNKITLSLQNTNKKTIYNDLLKNVFNKPNFDVIKTTNILNTFNTIISVTFTES